MILISDCKQLQENQAIAWFLKTKEKNPPKQETLDFLERIVHRVGETAENQRKTREKSKVAENQVFWLDFCAKKKNCAHPLWTTGSHLREKFRNSYFHCLTLCLDQLMGRDVGAEVLLCMGGVSILFLVSYIGV